MNTILKGNVCPVMNDGVKASREIQHFYMPVNYSVHTNHVLTVFFYSNMFLDYILSCPDDDLVNKSKI